MKENRHKELFKVIGATALTLTVASAAFNGANKVAFAAAAKPEVLTLTNAPLSAEVNESYPEAKLNVITRENLDRNGKAYPESIPTPDAISYEEAAEIGAKYIWDMFGENIDGKTVEMSFNAPAFSSRSYWHGTVVNSAEDLIIPDISDFNIEAEEGATTAPIPGFMDKSLYRFSVDAVTGDRVSINTYLDIPETDDFGEGKTYTVSPLEMEEMQYTAPENVSEFAEAAKDFASKHFNHSQVESVEFYSISLNHGSREESTEFSKAYSEAYKADKNKPFTFTLYEKGRSISFNVTDDTGRTALIYVDMDTKRSSFLDTTGSDFIPGFSADMPGAIG